MAETQKLSNIEYYRMRIKKGESIVAELKKFMLEKKPGSVTFIVEAGGGFTNVKCAFSVGGYKSAEFPDAPYVNYELAGPHEISGTTGNIVWHPETNEPMVHIHATLGSNKPETYVAHLHEATVEATAELLLITSNDPKVFRNLDEDLNLWLLNLRASETNNTITNPKTDNKEEGKEKWVIAALIISFLSLAVAIFGIFTSRSKK